MKAQVVKNTVIIPTGAGVGSAHGFLQAPIAYEVVRTRLISLRRFDHLVVNDIFADMRAEAEEVVRQGAPSAELVERREAFMRYRGQGHEINVELPVKIYTAADLEAFQQLFDDAYAFVNASGLNRDGRATPRALVDLLALTADDGSRAAAMIPILPGAGEDGTLRYRMPHASGRVRAKTGTMAGVTALSGIASSRNGQRNIGFSVIVNGGPTAEDRSLQDAIAERIVKHLDRSATHG